MKFFFKILLVNLLLYLSIFIGISDSSSHFVSKTSITNADKEKGISIDKCSNDESPSSVYVQPKMPFKKPRARWCNIHRLTKGDIKKANNEIELATFKKDLDSSQTLHKKPDIKSCQTKVLRYCALNSLIFTSGLNRIIGHVFISATIGVDNEGVAWISGITNSHKSILINSIDGTTSGPYDANIFLNHHQALCIIRCADIKQIRKKQHTQDVKQKLQTADELFFYYKRVQIAEIIHKSNEHLSEITFNYRRFSYEFKEDQLEQVHFFDDGVFLYPSKENVILQLEFDSQLIKHNDYITGNASKHILIQHDKTTKKLFIDCQSTEIVIPDTLLDAKDIRYKLNANGNVLLSIANQGRVVHVINLDTKHAYGPFVSSRLRLDSRFLDVSFWYEETLVFLEQSNNGTICFLKLNYEEDNKELKLVGSLEHQPIFHQASFMHNLKDVEEVVFFGITAENNELYTGTLTVKADPHPILCDLFSNIIDQYHEQEVSSMEIMRKKEMPISSFTGFGYDSEGKVYASTGFQIFPIDKALEEPNFKPGLSLTRNTIFFKENSAIVISTDNRFLLCQASAVINAYNQLTSAMHFSGEYKDDFITILKGSTINQIGRIDSIEGDPINVFRIYSNNSFILLTHHCTKFMLIQYSSVGVVQTTLIKDPERLDTRIPCPNKIFDFQLLAESLRGSKDETQIEKSIQVTLNGDLLKDLSQHMPVDYRLLEINESGTVVAATVHDGRKDKLFVYNLESDCHWYVNSISPDHINSIHFLDDQNLLLLFQVKENIYGDSDIKQDTKKTLIQHKLFLGTVSVASSDAQISNYKLLDMCTSDDPSLSFSSSLINKKHEKAVGNFSSSSKPATTESYYLLYQCFSRTLHPLPFLIELKVNKHDHKLPIAL